MKRLSPTRNTSSPSWSALRFPTTAAALVAALFAFGSVSTRLRAADPIPLTEAIASQRAALAAAPSADGFNDLGNLLHLDGQRVAAEVAYRAALDLDPERLEALYNLALLLQQNGKTNAALKIFQRGLKLAPDSAWIHFQIGLLQQEKGNRKEAIQSMARAFELNPELAFADVNPQVIGNNAATAALLMAEVRVAASNVPRLYSNPREVVSLLTSDLDGGPAAAPAASSRPAETAGQPRRERQPTLANPAAEPGAEPMENGVSFRPDEDLENTLESDEASAPANSSAPVGRVLDASSLRTGNPTNGSTAGSGEGRTDSSDGRSTGPSTRPAASRFQPGRRSSARVEWDLVPLENGSRPRAEESQATGRR
jgi:hypothetical protein